MNQFMTDECFCRTAPATTGLINTLVYVIKLNFVGGSLWECKQKQKDIIKVFIIFSSFHILFSVAEKGYRQCFEL